MNLASRFPVLRSLQIRLVAVCAAILLTPSTAFAIVGGSGVDTNTAGSPWAGVGSILSSDGTTSGALIAPNYVLTAAHVVANFINNPSALTFQLNAGATTQFVVEQVFLNSPYTSADGFRHNDVAILKLGSAAPSSVPFYNLYKPQVAAHTDLTLVGYGVGGDGLNGTSGGVDASVKRVGQNNADYFLPTGGPNYDIYIFDFDGPDLSTNSMGGGTLGSNVEATFAAGDSGSPAFVNVNNEWQIAGVNTFNGWLGNGPRPVNFGSIGGGMLVSAQADWINSVITTPVPEPQTWLMLVPGLAAIAAMARRRKQSKI